MSIYNIEVKPIHQESYKLEAYRDKVMLIVNTASQCGFTPQYEGLQQLYEEYQEEGLVILAFPSNQFRDQEPGSHEEILEFCQTRFDITFPVFEKIEVNGPQAHPLYQYLTAKCPGLFGTQSIKWNFTKFLVSRDEDRIERFSPLVKPEEIRKRIMDWL